MRLGIITPNFGRLIEFVSGVVYTEKDLNNFASSHGLKSRNYWIFQSEATYPFISQLLRSRIRIVSSKWIWLYRMLTKFPSTSGRFVASQDDYNYWTFKSWGGDFDFLGSVKSIKPSQMLLRANIDNGVNLEDFIIVHTRDSEWETSNLLSNNYVQSQAFRNSNLEDFRFFVETICHSGMSVVRTGRSKTTLFDEPRKNFYDYAASDSVSEENDFFLWSKAQKAIVSLNGGCNLGFLFGKSMLIWDYPESIIHLSKTLDFYPHRKLYLVPHTTLNSQLFEARKYSRSIACNSFIHSTIEDLNLIFPIISGPLSIFSPLN